MIVFLAALALGRFTVVAVSDNVAAGRVDATPAKAAAGRASSTRARLAPVKVLAGLVPQRR